MGTEIEKHIHLIKDRFALDLSMYDTSFLEQAFKARMQATGCETTDSYMFYLSEFPVEHDELQNQLSNSYSEFFRNPLTFAMFELAVLPRIVDDKEKSHSGELRIWSAGCASGQEPYSLSMLFDNFTGKKLTSIGYRIFATDFSAKEIDSARKAIFDFNSVKKTRLELAEKYFKRSGDTFLPDKKIKQSIDFSVYDLLDTGSSAPPASIFGDFDLIMCCNVLFYYKPEYQNLILQKFYKSLKKGGFLITGEAETKIVNSFGGFRQYTSSTAIYIKK